MIQGLDCIGRGNLREVQMAGMVQKIKKLGLLYQEPPACEGRGIVIAGGGKYLSWAWCVAKRIRDLGCELPIQVWYLGAEEMPEWAKPLFHALDVELVDAYQVMKTKPIREMGGWHLKCYAVMNCPWRHVLYVDADCWPEFNPDEMFNHIDIRNHGSMFFQDVGKHNHLGWGFVFCGLKKPPFEWETGQFIVDKKRVWISLRWLSWFHEHASVWWKLGHGDKFTTQIAFTMVGEPHLVSPDARWEGWGIGQYWQGKRWFAHAMGFKRGESVAPSPEIAALFEQWDALTASSPTVVVTAPAVA